MESLSKKEVEIIADLEFRKKYYFTTEDIRQHFENKKHIVNTIYRLRRKQRILKLNKNKYYLVPIKARYGKWTDNPLIVVDEICNGKDYFIGGWYAAYYWKLTDQIPMQVDIYTTRKQGKMKVLNKRFVFHRTSEKNMKKYVVQQITEHEFRIINQKESKLWMKSRE
ncbi:hypothetical protein J4232_04710 [Candidatus Woesearchaeota archaeon]|nr:hypothetical protein [Candidatus Woesearchaeota archaeon]